MNQKSYIKGLEQRIDELQQELTKNIQYTKFLRDYNSFKITYDYTAMVEVDTHDQYHDGALLRNNKVITRFDFKNLLKIFNQYMSDQEYNIERYKNAFEHYGCKIPNKGEGSNVRFELYITGTRRILDEELPNTMEFTFIFDFNIYKGSDPVRSIRHDLAPTGWALL